MRNIIGVIACSMVILFTLSLLVVPFVDENTERVFNLVATAGMFLMFFVVVVTGVMLCL